MFEVYEILIKAHQEHEKVILKAYMDFLAENKELKETLSKYKGQPVCLEDGDNFLADWFFEKATKKALNP